MERCTAQGDGALWLPGKRTVRSASLDTCDGEWGLRWALRAPLTAALSRPLCSLHPQVGPGEVDESLEDEVAEECTKYGQVNRVMIFEVTEPDFPPNEAVRIFVQFDRKESATKVVPPPCGSV